MLRALHSFFMEKHTKIYLEYYEYDDWHETQCEFPGCTNYVHDVHHIIYRSQGGKDQIEYLMGTCVLHHNEIHEEKYAKEWIKKIHLAHMKKYGKGKWMRYRNI